MPVIALMGIGFVFSVILRHFHKKRLEQPAFGVMFGIAIVLGMINPISLGEGLIFDTRTLLIGAAVAFVGPVAGAIALAIGIGCRIYLGGVGVYAGVVGLILAYAIAWAWCRYIHPRFKNRILADATFGAVITSSIVALFVLPTEVAIGIFMQISLTLIKCNIIGMVALGFVFRREINHAAASIELETHASTDPLTNLLNRRGFDTKTSNTKFNAEIGHAMFYFDVDDFKYINDTFGHEAGDATLSIIAKRIDENLRNGAIFSRQGGDEFSIYMPSVSEDDVKAIADRLCNLIARNQISHGTHSFGAAISMGGFWTKSEMPMNTMIDCADAQLLLAKESGKNRAQVRYDRADKLFSVA
jgi:diguanylate cyclase